MWIVIGIIIGGWIGAWDSLEAMVGGAVFGALIGAVVQWMVKRQGGDRLDALEARIAQLEAQLAILKEGGAAAPLTADSPVPEVLSLPPLEPLPENEAAGASRPAQAVVEPTRVRRRGVDLIDGESGGAPSAPSSLEQAWTTVRGWLLGGNTVVRVGLLVLFFGLAFLARYAAENSLFPIELRLATIAAGALVLLGVGWRLRARRPGYALSLQGGGVAALYLTIFAAMRLYALMPPAIGFALLLGVVVLSALLALLQRAQALAVIGTAGGFMAPILASTGQGSHVMLFAYYLLLNAGVLGIAWKQAWRGLNLTGFLFTFSIALFWGARDYRPALFDSTEPFLIAFFLMYVAAAVLYAWRSAPRLKHYVDGTVVFGTPVVGFGLQAALTEGMPHALAISALVVGGFYVLLARWLHARARPSLRLLVESFLALGIAFLTLAIPLAVDGQWTGAAWALEGAALMWVGLRQQRKLAIAAGVLLQLGAGVAFLGDALFSGPETLPLLNSDCLGAFLVALAGLASAQMAMTGRAAWPRALRWAMPALLVWGTLWWLGAGVNEIDDWVGAADQVPVMLMFFAASGALATVLARRFGWSVLSGPGLLALPGMGLALLIQADLDQMPLSGLGALAWGLAIVSLWGALKSLAHEAGLGRVLPAAHGLGVWAVVLAFELTLAFLPGIGSIWRAGGMLVVPAIAWWGMRAAASAGRWPMAMWPVTYLGVASGGMLFAALAWGVVISLATGGDPAPLPYLPILNALDLGLGLLLIATVQWWMQHRARLPIDARLVPGIVGGAAFLLVTLALIRAIHHLAGVPWDADRLFASDLVQTSVSLLWGALGLLLTFLASRRAWRVLWMAGAALLGVVVLKLFLIDMASTGTVARIVSFIGAGLVLLVVGYFSPLPPARETE